VRTIEVGDAEIPKTETRLRERVSLQVSSVERRRESNDAGASATFRVLEEAVLGRGLQNAAGEEEGGERKKLAGTVKAEDSGRFPYRRFLVSIRRLLNYV
jgi:hypothetical protein